MINAAHSGSWNHHPMPKETIRLNYSKAITAEEFKNISRGLIPEQMEDKWFAYLEGRTLFLHRSWTGVCIFQVELRRAQNGYVVSRVEVNNDPEQHRPRSIEHETSLVNTLIEYMGRKRD